MKILIIEDFRLISELLAATCRSLLPESSVEQACRADEGLRLSRTIAPDLVFLDMALPDGDGLALVPGIMAASPRAKIIVLTAHSDDFTLHRALAARVHGYVDKNEAPLEGLKDAIQSVLEGRLYLSPAARRLKERLQADPHAFNKVLSDHEQHLLSLFGDGLTNEQVADRLKLSAATVKVHRRNIMAKLDVHSTPQLIRYALEKGFSRLKRDASQPS